MKDFLVQCPKCGSAAEVTLDSESYLAEGKLFCSACSYIEFSKDLIRFNVVVIRNCDNCGQHFEKVIPDSKEKVDEISVSCPFCGVTRTFKPRNDEVRMAYKNSGNAVDPIFNLALWFQQEIRGNLFWAYNRKHLLEIKKYVGAMLRERQTIGYTTMVERLPNFIKDAKNRELILKTIEKLERK